jgi:anaerobic ribonucleoside-triphosphate reductase
MKNYNEIICWDCKKVLKKGAEYMAYYTTVGDFFKCKKCHKKDSLLRNYMKTEVYERVVGYIRPISQFNKGKTQERKDRKNYVI